MALPRLYSKIVVHEHNNGAVGCIKKRVDVRLTPKGSVLKNDKK